MGRTSFVFLFIVTGKPLLFAQQPAWTGVGIETNFMVGKMIKHTENFSGTFPPQCYSFELNVVKKTYGQKDWQQRRHYPQVGVGLYYNNYNKPDVYGQALGIFPNIQFDIIRGRAIEWTVRVGMGICYYTKPYQRLNPVNTENVAIGGHWNNISPFSTDLRWKINKHWDLQAGINFSHVSNASFQKPNLGINLYGAHIGVRYFPVTAYPEMIKRNLTPLSNRWLIQARAGMAFVEDEPADGPLNPVYIGAVYVSKRYWSMNKLYAGIDYYYHSATYARLKTQEDFRGSEYLRSTQYSLFLGHEFLIGRLGLLLQTGYYLHKKDEQTANFYQKLGGNFYLVQREKGPFKEVFLSAILKTHGFTAELFEMGVGVGL